MEQLRQSDLFRPCAVADFLLEKDRLFAELNLDANELSLYKQVAADAELDPPRPDLVVYLQAPARCYSSACRDRGTGYEQVIDATLPGAPGRGLRSVLL